jgi:CHRD domain
MDVKRLLLIGLTMLLVLPSLGQAQTAETTQAAKKNKVTICHRTGSESNPYVKISVGKAGLKGHMGHPGDIIPAPAGGCPATPMSPAQGGTALTATLTGSAEVPRPGDPDGSGQATIRLTAGEGRLCFQLNAVNIMLPATAAHIHIGAAGTAGGIVVPLTPPDAGGSAAGCVSVARSLVAGILANPGGYYVNIHTSDFPDGAIRGQLSP